MDLVIRNARVFGAAPVDIGIQAGKIVAVEANLATDAPAYDAEGHLVCAGLVETHIHLDKTRIIDRCPPEDGRNANAVPRVAAVKATFTERTSISAPAPTLENCIKHGTTRMRTHVELDGGVEMRSFDALERLRATMPGQSISNCACSRRRADQQQALRRTAGRGAEAWRSGDRRGTKLRP